MGTYGSSTSDLYNQTAGDFYQDFAPGAGWPAFCALGQNRTAYSSNGGIYTSTTRTNVKAAIDSFAAATVKASTGYTYTITGNTLNVNTATKFWEANNGDFYVNVYLLEDSVMNVQNGQSGVVAHHHVLRGGVSGSWGQNLVNGAVTANQTINKTFTYTIPADWNKSRLHVITMIWKKNGNDYRFINANGVSGSTTGIRNIGEAGNIRMYPNPTASLVNLAFDIDKVSDVSYTVTDITGKVVATKTLAAVPYGTLYESFNTTAWANGTYMVSVMVNNDRYTGKVVVAH